MNDQERLLTIFLRLQLGTSFEKKQLAQEFEVSEKTIQRDFSLLRDILSSNTSYSGDFLYNRKTNKYCLASKSVFNKKGYSRYFKDFIGKSSTEQTRN